jgi:hypothetical protein
LRSRLPKTNFAHYIAASAKVSTAITFLDHKLRRLLSIKLLETDQSAPDGAHGAAAACAARHARLLPKLQHHAT